MAKATIRAITSTAIITSTNHLENWSGTWRTALGTTPNSPAPELLPAGKYVVQARAKGYGNVWIEVPVIIRGGQTTQVHLDNEWMVPADISKTELVRIPNGYPVGWRAD